MNPRPVFGQGDGAAPVIVCLWQRPERLADVLDQLDRQDLPGGVRLLLWNNDPRNDDRYLQTIAHRRPSGALKQVEFISSDVNIGGAARMLLGRHLAQTGHPGPVVLIDDDQDIAEDFVRRLHDAWRPGTYAGVWAWRIHGDYWDRSAAADGEPATYVGTGGSIVDATLLGDSRLLRALGGRDLFLEDILLSAEAHRQAARVVGVGAGYSFALEETGQWRALADRKSRLYDELGRFAAAPRPAD